MYQNYWGLRQSPFPDAWQTGAFFCSETVAEALARVEFLVDQNYQLGVLVGEPGVGKSTLLRSLARQFNGPLRQTVALSLLGVEPEDFLAEVGNQLGEPWQPHRSPGWRWRRLQDRFKLNAWQGIHTILLLDDAADAEHETLTAIARLAQGPLQGSWRQSILLAADSGRCGLLGDRLLELSQLRIDLFPWELADTVEYLRTSLVAAGGTADVFDEASAETVHRLSQGLPRRIRQLAELTLIAGAGAELPQIDTETIFAVHAELRV